MISMTKNTQSRETLLQMAQKAFPGESCTNIRELTEAISMWHTFCFLTAAGKVS